MEVAFGTKLRFIDAGRRSQEGTRRADAALQCEARIRNRLNVGYQCRSITGLRSQRKSGFRPILPLPLPVPLRSCGEFTLPALTCHSRSRPQADFCFTGKTFLSLTQTGHSCKPHHFSDINDRNADQTCRLNQSDAGPVLTFDGHIGVDAPTRVMLYAQQPKQRHKCH